MNTTSTFTRGAQLPGILAQRIAVLDGAMGTMIQRYKLTEADYRGTRFADHPSDLKGNNDMLQLSKPEVILEIHEQYLAAGADIIETNTFGATTVAQDDYGLGAFAREMNVAAAKLARQACDKFSSSDKPRFVAGALGPTPKTASISPDVNDPAARNVTFAELRDAYQSNAAGLIAGGVDALIIETCQDLLQLKAAVIGAKRAIAEAGRAASGGPPQAGRTAWMAARTAGSSGTVPGRKRATTSPAGETRNFSKFHCTSPASPLASGVAVSTS